MVLVCDLVVDSIYPHAHFIDEDPGGVHKVAGGGFPAQRSN